jgi:hypothetical protein
MAAPITGTFMVPGVSKNGRLYTADAIAKAVTRMQERIADPNGLPITMRTHHAAEDDSTRIAAVVTGVALRPDGGATWEAYPASTTAGREIAGATQPGPDGKRPLAAVSIRGWWAGNVRTVEHDGRTVDTADDFEVDGIDFTANPGVEAARIETFEKLARRAAESHGHHESITESVEAELGKAIDADEAYITVSGNDDDYDADVRISAYVDDENIAVSAAQAGAAAQAALDVLNAADTGESDGDGARCAVCASTMTGDARYCPMCGAATGYESAPGTTLSESKESSMATKTTTPATEVKADEKVAETTPPAVEPTTPPAAPVTEAAPAPVTEARPELSEAVINERITTGIAAGVREATTSVIESLGAQMTEKITAATDAIRASVLESYGPPPRKGILAEAAKAEPLDYSKMSEQEFRAAQSAAWDDVLPAINR